MAGGTSATLAACANRCILMQLGTASIGVWGSAQAPLPYPQVSTGPVPAPCLGLARSGPGVARRKPRFAQARSASGSDATGSLHSRTTAVLRACRARLARPRATAPEARRRRRAGEHLGQQEPGPCPTPRSSPPTASAAR
jgi:hypothetical protein